MKRLVSSTAPSTAGFSMVELTLSLGIAAFCLLSVFALLPVGFTSNLASSEETLATGVLSSVVADLRACPVTEPRGGAATTGQYGIAIPPSPVESVSTTTLYFGEEDEASTSPGADSRHRVDITFLRGEEASAPTAINLKVSWPALATNPRHSIETYVALDRN